MPLAGCMYDRLLPDITLRDMQQHNLEILGFDGRKIMFRCRGQPKYAYSVGSDTISIGKLDETTGVPVFTPIIKGERVRRWYNFLKFDKELPYRFEVVHQVSN